MREVPIANSFTANLNLEKPEVGADSNLWGGHWNSNADVLDSIFTSATTRPQSTIIKSDTKWVDATNTTKGILFSLTSISTSTTRTLTVPDASDTLALLAAAQTFTNKTFTSPTITGPTITNADISGTSTIANAIINSAAINTATIDGATTGVTQTAGDSSTKLATTAFVAGAFNSVGPTTQVFATATTGTYTPSIGTKWFRARVQAAGGGGGGCGTATGPDGTAGGDSSFHGIVAKGGGGGTGNATASMKTTSGAGGTGGAGTANMRVPGSAGGWGGTSGVFRANGGGSYTGAGAAFSIASGPTNGVAASANSGAGGGGSSSTGSTEAATAGGGGEYFELIITSVSGTYTYTVGAAGPGGIGTGGGAATGGAGGSGLIVIEEHYSF